MDVPHTFIFMGRSIKMKVDDGIASIGLVDFLLDPHALDTM